ncbi:MAG: hypothetical protein FJW63_09810 [Actinobacteria bacterium]|nr:hypothetical protein [Actinomycetota bacterium]
MEQMERIMKYCPHCGLLKNLEDFHALSISKDGRHKICKICRNFIMRFYTRKNKEKIKERIKLRANGKKCIECGENVNSLNRKFCSCSCSNKYRFRNPMNHYAWKGDKASKNAIHTWLKKKIFKHRFICMHCGKIPERGKNGILKIHLANKSGLYKRDKNDWLILCISCHWKYDKPWLKRKRDILTGDFI